MLIVNSSKVRHWHVANMKVPFMKDKLTEIKIELLLFVKQKWIIIHIFSFNLYKIWSVFFLIKTFAWRCNLVILNAYRLFRNVYLTLKLKKLNLTYKFQNTHFLFFCVCACVSSFIFKLNKKKKSEINLMKFSSLNLAFL